MIAQILSSLRNNFKSWVTKFIFECFQIKNLIEDHIFFRIWDAGSNKQQLPGSRDRKPAGERGRKHVGSNVRKLARSCDRKHALSQGWKHAGAINRKPAEAGGRTLADYNLRTFAESEAGWRSRTIGWSSRTVGRNDFWVTQPWSGNLRKSFFHYYLLFIYWK